jgi:hypothetical protein
MKLLAKSPDDRFQSAAEVADLLERCLAHLQQPTITALPESIVESVRSKMPDMNLSNKANHERVFQRPSFGRLFFRAVPAIRSRNKIVASLLLGSVVVLGFTLIPLSMRAMSWQPSLWLLVAIGLVLGGAALYLSVLGSANERLVSTKTGLPQPNGRRLLWVAFGLMLVAFGVGVFIGINRGAAYLRMSSATSTSEHPTGLHDMPATDEQLPPWNVTREEMDSMASMIDRLEINSRRDLE